MTSRARGKQVNNRAGESHKVRSRNRIPRRTTKFGQVLDELRARYVFHNKDLSKRVNLFAVSDVEQISRMSNRVDAVVGMSEERRQRLIGRLAKAIARYVSEKGRWPQLLPGLETRIEQQLADAVEADIADMETQSLSVDIVEKLTQLTGLPIEQLAFDLYEPTATIDTVCTKWCRERMEGGNEDRFAAKRTARTGHRTRGTRSVGIET